LTRKNRKPKTDTDNKVTSAVTIEIPDPTPTDVDAEIGPVLASIPTALVDCEDTPELEDVPVLADTSPAAEGDLETLPSLFPTTRTEVLETWAANGMQFSDEEPRVGTYWHPVSVRTDSGPIYRVVTKDEDIVRCEVYHLETTIIHEESFQREAWLLAVEMIDEVPLWVFPKVMTAGQTELPAVKIPRIIDDLPSAERYCQQIRGIFGPRPGTFWSQLELESFSCYEVLGIRGDFVLCDFYQGQLVRECLIYVTHFTRDLWPYLTAPKLEGYSRAKPNYGDVFPLLSEERSRGLEARPELNCWVPTSETWWIAQPEIAGKSVVYCVASAFDTEANDRIEVVAEAYVQVSNKKESALLHLAHFLDGSLRNMPVLARDFPYPTDWIGKINTQPQGISESLKDSKTPIDHSLDQDLPPLRSIEQQCMELALELGVERTHVERLLDGGMRTLQSLAAMKEVADSSPVISRLLERIKGSPFLPQLREIFGTISGIGGQKVPSADAQQKIVDYINNQLEPRIEKLEAEEHAQPDATVDSLTATVETLQKEFNILCDRVDELESPSNKEEAKPKSAKAREKASAEARTLTLFPEEEPATPVKRPRGRPKGSKSKKKSDKPRKKTARASQPPPNKARPLAKSPRGKSEDQLPWHERFKRLIGEPYDQKIMVLLNRIAPKNRGDFLQQARKGLPNMKLTPWATEEQGRFAKWYFARDAQR
jgi:hypothetical protein